MSLVKTPDRLPASRRRLHEARERDRRHSPPHGIPEVGIIHDESLSHYVKCPKQQLLVLLTHDNVFAAAR